MTRIIDAYCTPGTERETQLSPERLLRMMDSAGVERAVIAPEDREIAVDNVAGNRRILEMARQFPDRFIPACTVNPWRGRDGCHALAAAVDDGARMLVLAPALQGFQPGDELADDLLAAAGDLDVPVYVHTGPHSAGAPSQLLPVAERHRSTGFILGHCGSTDYGHDMPAVMRAAPDNVWFEISLARPWAMGSYAEAVDPSRLIFGSSAPRNDAGLELRHLDQALPRAQYPGVYGGNLLTLIEEPKS